MIRPLLALERLSFPEQEGKVCYRYDKEKVRLESVSVFLFEGSSRRRFDRQVGPVRTFIQKLQVEFPQKITFWLVNSYIFNKIEENRSGNKNWRNFF
jgi:hypothetical protein